MAGFAPAQDQPDAGSRNQQEPTYEAPSILSRASSLLMDGFVPVQYPPVGYPDEQDLSYEAPSVLSRASSLLDSSGKPSGFSAFGKVSGVYDSSLTPVFAASQGRLSSAAEAGIESSFGVAFVQRWRRSKLVVEYRGAYRQYGADSLFNGLDQFFDLAYSRALARHVVLDFKNTLGTTTLANGGFAYVPAATLESLGIPGNDIFDNRTSYLESRVDLTWQESARLSFDVGGDGFVVRRQSLLLAGLNGYTARANVAYRLSSRQTIAANYNNTYYDYQRAFGDSRLQIPTVGYSAALARHWDFASQAGVARVETLGLTQIALNPAIVELTGQTFATITFSRASYLPVGEARLVRSFKTSSLTFDYAMGVTPGNGYYLTSRETSAAVFYSYIAGRRWEARGNVAYNRLSSLGQALGTFTNLQGGMEVFYNLTPEAHLDVRYDYRHYATENSILQKDSNRVSLGVAFSLGETFRTVR